MDLCGFIWIHMDLYGFIWIHMDPYMDLYGFICIINAALWYTQQPKGLLSFGKQFAIENHNSLTDKYKCI